MKLKTWEVIKALTENPKLRFRNNSYSYLQVNKEDGSIVWTDKDGSNVGPKLERFILYSNGPCCDNLHIEWELVPQEVTFTEAFIAWQKGRTITVDRSSQEAGGDAIKGSYQRAKGNLDNPWFYAKDIIHAKWFIEAE